MEKTTTTTNPGKKGGGGTGAWVAKAGSAFVVLLLICNNVQGVAAEGSIGEWLNSLGKQLDEIPSHKEGFSLITL